MARPRTAFVLAAGLGTRLRPLSDELPKPAWPFFDVPLAALVLQNAAAAGVTQAVVNLHHLGDRLQQELRPWFPRGLKILWSPEPEILGTGGALVPWRDVLSAGPFFLCNADTVQEIDLSRLAAFHAERGAVATLAVRPAHPGTAAPIEIADDGRIVRFLKSRAPGSSLGRGCEFTGVHLLDPTVLAFLAQGRFCINADVHARLVAKGEPLFGYVPPGDPFWSDVGTPTRYLGAHRALLCAGRVPPGAHGRIFRADAATREGGSILAPSYLGPGAVIARGAVVGPFAVVGSGAIVGGGARVEESVLWSGSRMEGGNLRNAVLSASGAILTP